MHDVAVCLGRFQPLHNGSLDALKQALAIAPHGIVVLGSSFQAVTPKHPWRWQERAEMVRLALPPNLHARLSFLPVRDYHDDTRWLEAVRRGVDESALASTGKPTPGIVLVGLARESSTGLGWDRIAIEPAEPIDTGELRDAIFAAGPDPARLEAAIASRVPPSTLAYLQRWCARPGFASMVAECQMLASNHAAWDHTPFPAVFVTVDSVVQCAGQVLLIRRGRAPGRGLLALPGGFIDIHESTFDSAVRELREETGLALPKDTWRASLREVVVFDDPERGQRGRALTHVHRFELAGMALPEVEGADDAQSAAWYPLASLASMEDQFHDDHFHMLDHFFRLTRQA